MLDAVNECLRFASGKSRRALEKDRMLVLALIKELEMIGEAAARVSEAFKREHPGVPWAALIATRNRLIHGYFDVDLDIVWNTAHKDLPLLKKSLAMALR